MSASSKSEQNPESVPPRGSGRPEERYARSRSERPQMLVLSPLRSAFQEAQRFAAPPISHRPGEWDAAALRRLVKASLGGAQIIVVSNRQPSRPSMISASQGQWLICSWRVLGMCHKLTTLARAQATRRPGPMGSAVPRAFRTSGNGLEKRVTRGRRSERRFSAGLSKPNRSALPSKTDSSAVGRRALPCSMCHADEKRAFEKPLLQDWIAFGPGKPIRDSAVGYGFQGQGNEPD